MGCRSLRRVKSERDIWNYFNGSGRRRAIRRRKLRKKFEKDFKQKVGLMRYILANVGRHLAEGGKINPTSKMRHMTDIHPGALQLLRRYGMEYKRRRWQEPPGGEPEREQCFLNAAQCAYTTSKHPKNESLVLRQKRLVYVEGVAYGPHIDPMLHGWNAYGVDDKHAMDWTFYAVNHCTLYFGIPFTYEEHQRLCRLVGHKTTATSFFHRENFTIQIKVEVIKILTERRLKKKKKPKSRKH